jgi:hypothetical protein
MAVARVADSSIAVCSSNSGDGSGVLTTRFDTKTK